MADLSLVDEGAAVTFMVSAGLVYEIIAAACSSPQTAEINADKRADTLMKWVHIGLGQAALFVVIAAVLSRKHPWAAIGGGSLAAVLMYYQYVYARRCGLASCQPGTEE